MSHQAKMGKLQLGQFFCWLLNNVPIGQQAVEPWVLLTLARPKIKMLPTLTSCLMLNVAFLMTFFKFR